MLRVYLWLHRLERLFSRSPGDLLRILMGRDRAFMEKVRLDHALDDIRHSYYLYPDLAFERLLDLERDAGAKDAVPEIWLINFIKRLRGVRNCILERKRFLAQKSSVAGDARSE